MKRQLRALLLALSLSVPSAAVGASGPQVPEFALSDVPDTVRAGWRAQDHDIAQLTRQIEAARSNSSVADSLDTVDQARRDLRAALADASNLEIEAKSAIQTLRLEEVRLRIVLDRAKLEERLARQELRIARKDPRRREVREARARRRDTSDERRDARDALVAVTDTAGRTERTARARLDVAEEAMKSAQAALNDLAAFSLGGIRRRTHPSEIALLEARRDLAVAELEHEQALAVLRSGGRIDMRPFANALDEARAAEEIARRGLSGPTSQLSPDTR